jgi:hypothetical protein
MTGRVNVDRITKENWETAWTPRCHAGMWMGAHVERDEDGLRRLGEARYLGAYRPLRLPRGRAGVGQPAAGAVRHRRDLPR